MAMAEMTIHQSYFSQAAGATTSRLDDMPPIVDAHQAIAAAAAHDVSSLLAEEGATRSDEMQPLVFEPSNYSDGSSLATQGYLAADLNGKRVWSSLDTAMGSYAAAAPPSKLLQPRGHAATASMSGDDFSAWTFATPASFLQQTSPTKPQLAAQYPQTEVDAVLRSCMAKPASEANSHDAESPMLVKAEGEDVADPLPFANVLHYAPHETVEPSNIQQSKMASMPNFDFDLDEQISPSSSKSSRHEVAETSSAASSPCDEKPLSALVAPKPRTWTIDDKQRIYSAVIEAGFASMDWDVLAADVNADASTTGSQRSGEEAEEEPADAAALEAFAQTIKSQMLQACRAHLYYGAPIPRAFKKPRATQAGKKKAASRKDDASAEESSPQKTEDVKAPKAKTADVEKAPRVGTPGRGRGRGRGRGGATRGRGRGRASGTTTGGRPRASSSASLMSPADDTLLPLEEDADLSLLPSSPGALV